LFSVLALAAVVAVAACDRDDPGADGANAAAVQQAPPGMDMDPEMMQLVMEMQTIQQELAPIQEAALEDEALAGQLVSLQTQVETAMRTEDPALMDRIAEIEAELMAAHESGDDERMQAVSIEAQGIQQRIQVMQASVLERPEIRQPIEAFEAAHRARMIEIHPEAEALLARADQIMERLAQ